MPEEEPKIDRRVVSVLNETIDLPTRAAFDAVTDPHTLRVRTHIPDSSMESLLRVPKTRARWLKSGLDALKLAVETEWELVADTREDPNTVATLSYVFGVPYTTLALHTKKNPESRLDDELIEQVCAPVAAARFTCRFPDQIRQPTPGNIGEVQLVIDPPTWRIEPPFNYSCVQGKIAVSMIATFSDAADQFRNERDGIFRASTFGLIRRRIQGLAAGVIEALGPKYYPAE